MYEKYFTAAQLEQIKERGRRLGPERIRQVEGEWPQLIEQVRAEMQKGTDPTSKIVQGLAQRWTALVHEFTGGDAGIARSVGVLYQQEPTVSGRVGIAAAIFEYISKAVAASKPSPTAE